MIKLTYYFFVFLFIFYACNNVTDTTNPPDDGGGGGKDTSIVSPVKDSINITFPEVDFTRIRAIKNGKPSKVIIDRLAGLIDAAPKDASIYMSVLSFKDEYGLMNAISSADKRGVKLHVMLDGGARDPNHNEATINKLKAIGKDIDIVAIYNDAHPKNSGAINHNKFALFSKVITKSGDKKNVVFTGSENWAPFTEKENQNAVILSNKGLYQAYLHYWREMKKRAAHGMIDYTFEKYSDPQNGIYALFYPKRKKGKYYGPDTIINILNDITDPASTTIQIVMPFWTDCRSYIVDKLSDLMGQGAKVAVIVRSSVGSKVHDGLVALADKGAFVKMYNYAGDPDVKQIQTHSKVMLIQGEWKGVKTNVIITGSENFTCYALKYNNENNIILSSHNLNHPKIFQHYEDHFDKLKKLPGVCCMENK